MPDDFYDLLGLSRDATQDDVKRAYREKVREYHPDLNDDPRAQAQFTALKKAYDTLGDPKERDDYDRLGHENYVAKRINGLPSQDKWATGGSAESSSESAGTSATAATASTASGSTTTGSASDRATSTGDRDATAGKTTSAGTTGNHDVGDRRSRSTGRTASRRSRRRRDRDSSGLLSRIRRIGRIGVGWPLIFLTDVLYVVGLELFLGTNQTVVWGALEGILAAGADVDALRSVLLRPSLGAFEFVTTTHYVDGAPVAGAVLVLGSVILPLVYGVVIHDTRTSFSAWNPTRLYVVAALGPLVGLGVAAAGVGRLGIDLLCFVALPLATIVLLPLSAFVRPWILRTFRR